MSVNLYLLPFDADGEIHFSHTVLSTVGSYDWHDKIRQLPSFEVPPDFSSFVSNAESGQTEYGNTTEDSYGDPVKWTEAGLLVNCAKWSKSERAQAIRAYLMALEPHTKVAMFWH